LKGRVLIWRVKALLLARKVASTKLERGAMEEVIVIVTVFV
jgi:hypothetical protein